ncbi:MAG: HEAT repeat domain-containing protein [Planctomycetota bacterium]|nr:MAG: HEAT repeat domain-containing protein [Planctomycetota bacterium]
MKISLPLKLGILIVALFGVVIAGMFLYQPMRYSYLKSRLLSDEPMERDAAIRTLAAEGEKVLPILRRWLKSGDARLVGNTCLVLINQEGDYWKALLPELEELLDGPVSDITGAAAGLLIAKNFQWEEKYEENSHRIARFIVCKLENMETYQPEPEDEEDSEYARIIELDKFGTEELCDIMRDIRDPSITNRLVHILRESPNNSAREDAAYILGELKENSFVELLGKKLESDTSRIVRNSIASALGEIGDRRAVQPLVKALENDKSKYVRVTAARALGMIGDEQAVRQLIKTLGTDMEAVVRAKAAIWLGIIEREEAVPALIIALKNDRDKNVKCKAAYALGRMAAEPAMEPLLDVIKAKPGEEPEEYGMRVTFEEIPSLPIINSCLSSHRGWVDNLHRSAIIALGKLGNPKVVETIVTYLQPDVHPGYREAAAWALGYLGSRLATKKLCASLANDSVAIIRNTCAKSLGLIADKEAIGPLTHALAQETDNNTRALCAWALGQIGDSSSISTLLGALENDADIKVRIWSAQALGEIGGEKAIEPLARIFNDSLELLKKSVFPSYVDDLCWMIAWALGKLGGDKAVKALENSIEEADCRGGFGIKEACILSLLRLSAPGAGELIDREIGRGYEFPYIAAAWKRGGKSLEEAREELQFDFSDSFRDYDTLLYCYAEIRWGNAGGFEFLVNELSPYVGPEFLLKWFHNEAFSYMPEGFPQYDFMSNHALRKKQTRAIKDWYEKHKDRLTWDAEKRKYYLIPEVEKGNQSE